MANEEQLAILRQGVKVWNKWRDENSNVVIDLEGENFSYRTLKKVNLAKANLSDADFTDSDFQGADFTGANLSEAELTGANLVKTTFVGANLKEAYLIGAKLTDANFTGADLSGAKFIEAFLDKATFDAADLYLANFENARLRSASFIGAELEYADFTNADLGSANFSNAKLTLTDFTGADLSNVNFTSAKFNSTNLHKTNLVMANFEKSEILNSDLSLSNFVQAKVEGAIIQNCYVYGCSVWDLEGEFKNQAELSLHNPVNKFLGKTLITVDDLEVAQFIYLLLNNQKIRNVIDTVTTKTVLILGRFTEGRKQILDALRDALRKRGFIPILFDFQPSPQRDITETIQLLANMAKFIIADITEAKSIPQELSHIIPFLPSVPVQPILLVSSQEYGMFEHWRGFNSVLPEFLYEDEQHLIDNLEAKLILPINAWHKNQDKVSILEKQIKELQEKLSRDEREI
jgi:uncharacterized protein YjbI with pentapeptide repeats